MLPSGGGSHVNAILRPHRSVGLFLVPACGERRIEVPIEARYVHQDMIDLAEGKHIRQVQLMLLGLENELGIDTGPAEKVQEQERQRLAVAPFGLQDARKRSRIASRLDGGHVAEAEGKLLEQRLCIRHRPDARCLQILQLSGIHEINSSDQLGNLWPVAELSS